MVRYFKFSLILLALLVTGCAHNIQLSPSLDGIRNTNAVEIDTTVGYYVSSVDKAKEVITPGGGGDKVKYSPYKDTEAALNTVLSKVFTRVYSVPSLSDDAFISQKGITYIFKPTIKTDSRSSSAFTWPPTDFTFELTCEATDASGNMVWSKTVTGEGNAEFDEFKHDFSLSARRASEKAYMLMLEELIKADVFRTTK